MLCWPVNAMARLMAVLRIPVGFRPTPKTPSGGLNLFWLAPQATSILLMSAGAIFSIYHFGVMTTKVLDLALERMPAEIRDLDDAEQVFLIYRLGGQPVGSTWVRVESGCISAPNLRRTLLQVVDRPLCERLLFRYLDW
jgi:hypothetical protein